MISAMRSKVAGFMALAITLGCWLPAGAVESSSIESGAKGLFFEQLDKPDKQLNTGLQYWIDLQRNGKKLRVTNKFRFKSGDRIRFHVRSNINGYAYILLRSGSRGEKSVLFPDKSINDDNRVKGGKEYVLPQDGFLTFDDNPGLEKLSLVLSRRPLDAKAYLEEPLDAPTLIASSMSGSKDLVPARVLVQYPKATKTKIAVAPKKKDEGSTHESARKKPKKKIKRVKTPQKKTQTAAKPAPKASNTRGGGDGSVTVVSKGASDVLHIDVALEHI